MSQKTSEESDKFLDKFFKLSKDRCFCKMF